MKQKPSKERKKFYNVTGERKPPINMERILRGVESRKTERTTAAQLMAEIEAKFGPIDRTKTLGQLQSR